MSHTRNQKRVGEAHDQQTQAKLWLARKNLGSRILAQTMNPECQFYRRIDS
ncbi:hypothetical protein PROFUN_02240 [Planoprotostelium fungivorum]|uniref:Uncharacterized protein n=1 Tax=Planoprotostelium fungivorum TaxID=1890364 RepID=A0A2P6NYF9_9EUKA|nr:hypothetical protein PROFUN_02240 [Planoprotostelium fungivorum]